MTRTTSARIAGFTFLFYIGAALAEGLLFGHATGSGGIAAKLARLATHACEARISILLSLLASFSALVLAVTLYGVTRDQNHEIAMLALTCRVGEGVLNAIPATLGLLWLATKVGGPVPPDATTASTLGAFFLGMRVWSTHIGATFFAVGSTLFSYLLLRGRMIPAPLGWLGVLASVLLVATLPAQLAGLLRGAFTGFMWVPMALFEVTLAMWLLIKGVPPVGSGR